MNPAAQELLDLGFDVIPLRAGGKNPILRGWQSLPPMEQWYQAPEQANLGIRCGGENRTCIIDCDEKKVAGTFERVKGFLGALGFDPGDYPVVQTASMVGRHIYVSSAGDVLPGNYQTLSREFGSGELRYGEGACVVSPPSLVGDSVYALISGDFRQLPHIQSGDLLPLIGGQIHQQGQASLAQIQPLARLPRHTWQLISGIGERVHDSRSELEQAIITGLVNAGFDLVGVMAVFVNNRDKPGLAKFAELYAKNHNRGLEWLRVSYESAVQFCRKDNPARIQAGELLEWGSAKAWTGRTGASDRAVYLAHCQIAQRAGRLIYCASVRELAEMAGISTMTAARANSRLMYAGLIELEQSAIGELSHRFKLNVQNDTLPHREYLGSVTVCKYQAHDSFRRAYGGLGKSGFEIWQALRDNSDGLNAADISGITGRHISTVGRLLQRMSSLVDGTTGEILALVEKQGEKWLANDVDLDQVAMVLGTAGLGRKQREKHQEERRNRRRLLEAGRKAMNSG